MNRLQVLHFQTKLKQVLERVELKVSARMNWHGTRFVYCNQRVIFKDNFRQISQNGSLFSCCDVDYFVPFSQLVRVWAYLFAVYANLAIFYGFSVVVSRKGFELSTKDLK